ncbi:MAG: protein-L-isoaspartate O-methyltransferase [Phenylobacterium sp.]|jgi:protein-L-isoaspartate(D-aspartate) O-methyltransferase|uniref:protein-L-isoaspartate O-methyltransferase family protein n=1 Tax=Phenylobacterium sp. TaxID=1871053 RepID=UPI002A3710D7|nr:protein-L-isoaspartate O-methyltransferase [Phenylobacterium sp.]MDX9997111.1 protein-L-isoaspartate O-methyltransferase [Phenylobacterium sp.]
MVADLAAARINMVESQVRTNDVTDLRIQDAMRQIPRERFVPSGKAYLAYADVEVEYAPGRVLLRPRDVAKLLHALRPEPGERALAIAAPYAAAVLEHVGLKVDRLEEGDLSKPAGGGYDLIVCEGAVAEAPQAWIDALGPGGRLGGIERGERLGRAMVYVRSEDGVGKRPSFDASAAFLPGFEPKHGFAF